MHSIDEGADVMAIPELAWPNALGTRRHLSDDAVVIVPGIMGTELIDAESRRPLWGLRRLGWYVRAWSRGEGLEELALTEDELAGKTGRVLPNGLLRFPAYMPLVSGMEPYGPLTKAIRRASIHPEAVLEFGYDWRLPVRHNAVLLAAAAGDHLERWRKRADRPDAQLVFVAHSMGGLLCRAMPQDGELTRTISATVTMGTPFDGAVKAAVILGSGEGAPVPARRLRDVARTMPGIYDLLPMYRCVHDGLDVRHLTPTDIANLGGIHELAEAAFDTHRTRRALTEHLPLVGLRQPTPSSITIDNGVITMQGYTFRPAPNGDVERMANGIPSRFVGLGDGTVPRNSAVPERAGMFERVSQQHGSLASCAEAIDFILDVLRHRIEDRGPRLGNSDGIGIDVPDHVQPGIGWRAEIAGASRLQAMCVVSDADSGEELDHPDLMPTDDKLVADITLPAPGLYRITVTGGGGSPVSQLVMAAEPAQP
ncbi:hypothetical protein OG563_43645 [Nocardia vinacea]|uniref:Lecithin:cholesterol acyltransferase n=1 Tax=Nocardia vinacea TaxID=96468 RepID=A0ABZ1YRL2_9NOCA|nr:hypothetical protein [Nocardia vinacea]